MAVPKKKTSISKKNNKYIMNNKIKFLNRRLDYDLISIMEKSLIMNKYYNVGDFYLKYKSIKYKVSKDKK